MPELTYLEAINAALHDEMDTIRRRFGTPEQTAGPPEPRPLPVLPGPIP